MNRVEFSRAEDDWLYMYGATERYCYLGQIRKDEALRHLTDSQKRKLNKLYEVDPRSAGKDVEYMVEYEVVLVVDSRYF